MATVEAPADEQLVGLGPEAEERPPAEWVRARQRASDVFALALLVAVQVAWLTALAYAAYLFV